MPLFHDKKICYIHIPKTGGTSVINYFRMPKNLDSMFGMDGNRERSHFSQLEIQEICDISDYFKFVFIRNPWDRLASEFAWRMAARPNRHGILNDFNELNEFVSALEAIFDDIINNKYPHRICNHFFPQNWFFHSVDFVGRYETFREDLEKLGKMFNIDHPIPHENKAKTVDYRSLYNDNSIEIVKRLYSDDIRIFGYDF